MSQTSLPNRKELIYGILNNQQFQATTSVNSDDVSVEHFAMLIDNQNNAHFFWHGIFHSGPSWHYITQYRKKDSSGNWREIETLNLYEQVAETPCLISDGNNNIHLVWHSLYKLKKTNVSKINYLAKNGDFTIASSTINSKSPYSLIVVSPSISLDSQNKIYLVWKRYDEKYISLKEYSDNEWQEAKNLFLVNKGDVSYLNLLWSNYPLINNKKTSQPKTGFAFIFYQDNELKFYASEDLEWD